MILPAHCLHINVKGLLEGLGEGGIAHAECVHDLAAVIELVVLHGEGQGYLLLSDLGAGHGDDVHLAAVCLFKLGQEAVVIDLVGSGEIENLIVCLLVAYSCHYHAGDVLDVDELELGRCVGGMRNGSSIDDVLEVHGLAGSVVKGAVYEGGAQNGVCHVAHIAPYGVLAGVLQFFLQLQLLLHVNGVFIGAEAGGNGRILVDGSGRVGVVYAGGADVNVLGGLVEHAANEVIYVAGLVCAEVDDCVVIVIGNDAADHCGVVAVEMHLDHIFKVQGIATAVDNADIILSGAGSENIEYAAHEIAAADYKNFIHCHVLLLLLVLMIYYTTPAAVNARYNSGLERLWTI